MGLQGKDEVKWKLIHTYLDKVSARLKAEIPIIEARAKANFDSMMTDAMMAPSTFLNKMKLDDCWNSVPITFPMGGSDA